MAHDPVQAFREMLGFGHHESEDEVFKTVKHEMQGHGRLLRQVLETQRTIVMNVDKIKADIAAQTTLLQGAVRLIQGLNVTTADQSKQIADLKAALASAGTSDKDVQAALDALDESIKSNSALISDAMPVLTQNTDIPQDQAKAAATEAAASTG